MILEYDPKNIRASILKGIDAKYNLSYICAKKGVKTLDDMKGCPTAQQAWQVYQNVEDGIFDKGFEPMPKELYDNWLKYAKEQKEYHNNVIKTMEVKSK